MSRLGNKPVAVPAGVTVTLDDRQVGVKGPLGSLAYVHRPEVTVAFDNATRILKVARQTETRQARAYHGLTRALLQNMVVGVTQGFRKELDVIGVGYTARLQGRKLILQVGYADPRELDIPEGVKVEVATTRVTISGPDRQAVGQFAAQVRAQRPPEPYNGKGIKYVDEVIVRKVGKAFAAGAAT